MMHMASTTTGLAVNSAFLNEIKEDHSELNQLLAKTDRALKHSLNGKPRELVYLLLALQDRVAIHFSLEEAYGYCEDALEIAPWLSAQAAALRAEHQPLFAAVCHLARDAEKMLTFFPSDVSRSRKALASIAADYVKFRDALEKHEQGETELILASFDDDIGVGD